MVSSNKKKLKGKKTLTTGVIHINATFNNTIITVASNGETYAWDSGGTSGFKGAKKSTPFAAQEAMKRALGKAIERGMKTASVHVKGPGSGRDPAIKILANFGDKLTVTSIRDVTPIPHNGCRAPKKKSI